ncbi:hypothetical protein A0J61_02117 [Choanephora cucurbitarum]|uniref:Uncharacterized protein n=1 Tax=Choanephora cucurbitarum TaxID=101091 RepID=A0A1C7NLJ5_9FUNG|nr:hypothetical protein A0J61_02117 [Choanephora cucurbitarum]
MTCAKLYIKSQTTNLAYVKYFRHVEAATKLFNMISQSDPFLHHFKTELQVWSVPELMAKEAKEALG